MSEVAPKRRNTRQRQMVLELVKQRCDHPTADDIYLEIRDLDPRVSRATVYRNLHLLVDSGDLISVRNHLGVERFDRRIDTHSHVICDSCGELVDAPAPTMAADFSDVEEASGFKIDRQETIYHGICSKCQAKLAATKQSA